MILIIKSILLKKQGNYKINTVTYIYNFSILTRVSENERMIELSGVSDQDSSSSEDDHNTNDIICSSGCLKLKRSNATVERSSRSSGTLAMGHSICRHYNTDTNKKALHLQQAARRKNRK